MKSFARRCRFSFRDKSLVMLMLSVVSILNPLLEFISFSSV